MNGRHAALFALLLPAPILPGAAFAQAAQAPAAEFAPPAGAPMVLTRTVIRPLKDGNTIVARRSWRIRFVKAEDGGWQVQGTLLRATVDAPPALDELAAIERNRPDGIAWPLRLGTDGTIAEKAGADTGSGTVEQAIAAMQRQLPGKGGQAGDRDFIARVRAAAAAPAVSHWPADLFLPGSASRADARTFALPGDMTGKVATRFTRTGKGGTMATAERRVTTVIDGESEVATERWTLSPADGKT